MDDFDNDIFSDFRRIFKGGRFELPVRCQTGDYLKELTDLLTLYKSLTGNIFYFDDNFLVKYSPTIERVCDGIIEAVKDYLNGKSSKAVQEFSYLFEEILIQYPLIAYDSENGKIESLDFFRSRKVDENRVYAREEIFHTPFELRNKVDTARYSISGYPSLYLSSSVQLCLEEMESNINPSRYIVSRFEIAKEKECRLQILDLGIKPSDFLEVFNHQESAERPRTKIRQKLLNKKDLLDPNFIAKYMLWYPLIAACSFMRVNKKDPFAAEYIVPQILMQTLRSYKEIECGKIVGIRFFSCISRLASDMGFNYVFPTHYTGNPGYCERLKEAFRLSKPEFVNDFARLSDMERSLKAASTDFI